MKLSTVFTSIAMVSAAPVALGAQPVAALATAPPSSAGGLLQVLFGLTVVLLLLAAAAWALKRYGSNRATGGASVRVIGGVSLGGRERVMLIEAADQWIVVGVAPGSVNALATMPRQETAALPESQQPATNFAGWLKHTLEKRNGH